MTDYEVWLRRKDGASVLVSTSSHLYYNSAGDILGVEGTFRDITELKRTEKALSSANNKLKLLSSITRHDINNQLTILKGYLVLLETEQSDTSFGEYFKKINTSAQRIFASIQFTKTVRGDRCPCPCLARLPHPRKYCGTASPARKGHGEK